MSEWSEALKGWVELFGPNRYVQAAVVVAASLIAARVADWVLTRTIKVWTRRTKTDFDDRLIAMMHRPIFVTVLIIGLDAAVGRLGMAGTPMWVTASALKTLVVWVWLVFGLRFIALVIEKLARNEKSFPLVQSSSAPLLRAISQFALAGAAIYFVMLSWNVDLTAWLASAGIIGLALSFAAKDSLANLFAGMFILADAPYKVGDFINLDTGDRGRVTQIGIRSTRILTRDDIEIIVPNSVIGNATIVNESGGPHEKARVRVPVGVAYGSDIDKVERVLMQVAAEHTELCRDPEPRVRFRSFGDSSLDFELLAWIAEPVLRGQVLHLLHRDVYKAFAREGIQIPFPQRDVHVRDMPGPGDRSGSALD